MQAVKHKISSIQTHPNISKYLALLLSVVGAKIFLDLIFIFVNTYFLPSHTGPEHFVDLIHEIRPPPPPGSSIITTLWKVLQS